MNIWFVHFISFFHFSQISWLFICQSIFCCWIFYSIYPWAIYEIISVSKMLCGSVLGNSLRSVHVSASVCWLTWALCDDENNYRNNEIDSKKISPNIIFINRFSFGTALKFFCLKIGLHASDARSSMMKQKTHAIKTDLKLNWTHFTILTVSAFIWGKKK